MDDFYRDLADAYLEMMPEDEVERLRDENEYFDDWLYSPERWEDGESLESYNEACRRRDYY